MILKKINVWSMAKVYGILMGIMGLILELFSGIFSLVFSQIPYQDGINPPFAALGPASIIVFPIVYAVMGVIVGAITALIYNLAAKLVGGIELEFDKK